MMLSRSLSSATETGGASASDHSIGVGRRVSAWLSTSSIVETGMISSSDFTLAGMSSRSFSFSSGISTVFTPERSAASSYVRSRATKFGIEPPLFERTDVHIHVPDGATPKDGPSAGAAMATAIVSVLTGIPIKKDIAMTGEVTLRGRVTAIGGLKEKLLAALRSGVKTVLIPQENEKDLADIPDNVKSEMKIIPISTMDEVLAHALTRAPVAIEWSEADAPAVSVPDDSDVETVLTH